MPITAYGQHTIPGYLERLQVRRINVPLGKQELQKTLEEVDTCMAEFSAKVQRIINTVWEYGQTTWSKLQQVRTDLERDINLAIEEVERTMDQDDPALQYELSQHLRNYGLTGTSLKLFSYYLNTSEYPASLDNVLQITHGLFTGEQRYLPAMVRTKLILYALRGGETHSIEFAHGFKQNPMCVIDDQTVILMMAKEMSNPRSSGKVFRSVYSFDLRSSQFTELEAMRTPRRDPGILKHNGFIYVFGGQDPQQVCNLNSCEKLNLITKSWTPLPDMLSAKHNFTPCLFESEVYLPCVSPRRQPLSIGIIPLQPQPILGQLEAFNIHTEQFKMLPITLPDSSSPSVSFIVDGELIIIARSQMDVRKVNQSRCRVATETTFRVSDVESSNGESSSSVPPIQIGRNVYWVSYDTLNRFNLDTNSITQTRDS